MVDYIFTDGSGNRVVARTNGTDKNTENLTIMDVTGLDTDALKVIWGRRIDKGSTTTKAALVAIATALGYNLNTHNMGQADPTSDAYTAVYKQTLAASAALNVTVIGATQLNLAWSAVAGANNYVVDRATNAGFTTGVALGIYSGPLLAYNNTGLVTATHYYYRVKAQGLNYTDSAYATDDDTTS